MPEPIFVRTRYDYDSYRDFWALVELSEFETCFVDEIDLQSENTYIVTPVNGELRPHISHRRAHGPQHARVIWWNLERPDGPGTRVLSKMLDDILQYVDEVWVSDRYYASLDPRHQFVPLGSHRGLAHHRRSIKPEYDVALMACANPRRDRIIYDLKRGTRRGPPGLLVAPNAWGDERSRILSTTTVLLNTHQHDEWAPIGEPLRIALAAAHEMCLISEWIDDPWPLEPHFDIIRANNLADIVGLSRIWAASGDAAREMGRRLHQTLCVNHTFRICVSRALFDR